MGFSDLIFDAANLKTAFIGFFTYAAVTVLLCIYRRHRKYQMFKELGIPGPPTNLLDGNLSDVLNVKSNWNISLGWRIKYGKVFGHFLGEVPHLHIVDPILIRKFLIDNPTVFVARNVLFIETKPLSESVLFLDGDRWRSVRKTLTPTFSQYRVKGEETTKFIDESISKMRSYLESLEEKGETIINVLDLMKSTALHLISSMAIKMPGVEVTENSRHVKILDEFLDDADGPTVHWAIRIPTLQSILSWIGTHVTTGPVLNDILRELRASMSQLLKDYEKEEAISAVHRHNIFEKMVRLHKEGSLSKNEVLGNAIAILLAGYDTTSTTMSYFLWVCAKYPHIQERLRSDIIANGVESPYLKMVLNETMRLYPVVETFTKRVANRDITIDELTIKKGVTVVVDSMLLHRDPELWPDPWKFNPERFADMSKIDSCAFVPFGVGQRLCLGYQLANLEMKLIASELLMTYKFTLVSPKILELVTHAHDLTTPSEPIKLRFSRI